MEKPKYLYHGSTQRLDKIIPQQATGLPEENGNRCGVYAYSSFDMARRFAMPIEPVHSRVSVIFEEESGKIVLKKGIVKKADVGYVYRIPSESFQKIDQWQWLSESAVVPEEITEVKTEEIWDCIEFVDGFDR